MRLWLLNNHNRDSDANSGLTEALAWFLFDTYVITLADSLNRSEHDLADLAEQRTNHPW